MSGPFARYAWGERTFVMGILNVTPDSFSGDALGDDVPAALAQGERFVAEGADFLDVGGASSRPGFDPTPIDLELQRVLPVIEGLRRLVDVPISIDTTNATVARDALAAGATIVNDINGLRTDPGLAHVVAAAGAGLVAMHNQRDREFHDVAGDILAGWAESLRLADAAGIPRDHVVLDPGFGFGWTVAQNLEMVRRLPELRVGRPILLGTSRKSTLGAVLGDLPVDRRLEGTLASVAVAIALGVDIVRVHDVAAVKRAALVADGIVRGRG